MRKVILFLLGIFCLHATAQSQQLNPSVIAAEGGVNKAAGISLEWTLGEPFTESLPVSDGLFTQGFHQPLLVVTKMPVPVPKPVTGYKIAVVPAPITNYKITVAPNPVQSYLIVSIPAPNPEEVILSLIDFAGRITPVRSVNGKATTIRVDMTAMIPGIYLLEIRKPSGELIQTFKIIKAQ